MGALATLRAATDPQVRGGQYYGPDGFGEQRGHPKLVPSSAQSHDEDIQRAALDGVRGAHRRHVPGVAGCAPSRNTSSVVAGLIAARPAVTVPLADALGLVLAADVVAPLSLPGFDNSAMDGYAVLADDVAGASAEHPVRLPVAEDIPAGRTDPLTLAPGTAHRIMTGAPLPSGATAVVPVEATDGDFTATTVQIRAAPPARPARPPRRRGRHRGHHRAARPASWSPRPRSGSPPRWGSARSACVPRPRVLVMSTGTELVAPGTPLLPGQIYESNAVMLAAAVRDAGARGGRLADDR